MASKLIIDPEAQNEIDKAIEWYESQQKTLVSSYINPDFPSENPSF